MVLKFLIIHSYSSLSAEHFRKTSEHWTDSEKNDFDKEFDKGVVANVSSMKDLGIWDSATMKEQNFLSSTISSMDSVSQMNASWRMESAVTLMWALNLIEQFPDFNEQSSPELLKQVELRRSGLFSHGPSLRAHDEIAKMRDIMETWHWRVNTRRLVDDKFDFQPAEQFKTAGLNTLDDIITMTTLSAYSNGDIKDMIDDDFVFRGQAFRTLSEDDFNEAASIIIERHYALNWLCGLAPGNNWDETPTDT